MKWYSHLSTTHYSFTNTSEIWASQVSTVFSICMFNSPNKFIVEIYPGVRRLASLLGFDFAYPTKYKRSLRALAYPECQIICLIVIVTKLCHPFDKLERTPFSEDDPTTVKIDWQKWKGVMVPDDFKHLKAGDEIKTIDTNVLDMNDGNIDAYLDWYQRAWIDDRDSKSNTLFNFR
jgi:RNA polymerase I-specific transcription initiation factor RRN7